MWTFRLIREQVLSSGAKCGLSLWYDTIVLKSHKSNSLSSECFGTCPQFEKQGHKMLLFLAIVSPTNHASCNQRDLRQAGSEFHWYLQQQKVHLARWNYQPTPKKEY